MNAPCYDCQYRTATYEAICHDVKLCKNWAMYVFETENRRSAKDQERLSDEMIIESYVIKKTNLELHLKGKDNMKAFEEIKEIIKKNEEEYRKGHKGLIAIEATNKGIDAAVMGDKSVIITALTRVLADVIAEAAVSAPMLIRLIDTTSEGIKDMAKYAWEDKHKGDVADSIKDILLELAKKIVEEHDNDE